MQVTKHVLAALLADYRNSGLTKTEFQRARAAQPNEKRPHVGATYRPSMRGLALIDFLSRCRQGNEPPAYSWKTAEAIRKQLKKAEVLENDDPGFRDFVEFLQDALKDRT